MSEGLVQGELWRAHSDAVNRALIERWLRCEGTLLKTDLYDEAVGVGPIFPPEPQLERVVGIDVDRDIVEEARRAHPWLEAWVADVRRLPFEDGEFDAIVSNSTLDHFAGPEQVSAALSELFRVLRPGGELLVTLDNPANPLIALRNRLPDRLARRLRHGFPYPAGWTTGRRGLSELLAARGFAIHSTTSILHSPRALVALAGEQPDSYPRRLRRLLALERLERLPTRNLTGHFVAALAQRPG